MRQRAAASLLYQSQYAEPAFRNLQKSIFLKIVGRILAFYTLTEVRHRTKSAFCSSPWLVAGDEMYTQYVTTMGDRLASHYSFQLRYFKISEIQAIRFSQRDSENPHKRILDILPIVDLYGLINRSHNLCFHSGLNIHTVTRFSSFGFNSIEGHITA